MPPLTRDQQVSTLNSTTSALNNGETFTGTWEQNPFPDVLVSLKTDTSGTLYFDFSPDGTNADSTFPPSGFTITAGTNEFHTAVKGSRYFRIRIVNDSGSNQTYLRCHTEYGTFRQGNTPMNFAISADSDAKVVKAVLSGIGNTTAIVTDHQALQVTPPPEGKTAFGEALYAEPTPIIQVDFAYDTNLNLINTYQNTSGTVTQGNRMLVVQSGAAANSFAEARTKRILKYNPGQGSMARFTALFTTGVANSTQIAGIGNESDGFFFGYNGTSFGILHRKDGQPEIRTLTISTASTTAEDITITLDGDAATDVTVTNSGNTTTTANEIASYDYTSVGTGWVAKAVGSTVEFKSLDAATHSGTFSLSSATSAVGSFAQNVTGTAPTETWIAQASWNGTDIFDGNGLSGTTLDPTKGNVYQIKYQYLGFGIINFYVEDPDDGEMHKVHSIAYANANTTPSLGDPSLTLMLRSANDSNTSNLTVKTGSLAGFIEGKPQLIGLRIGARNTKTTVTTSLLPIISIRQGIHKNTFPVQTYCKIMRAAFAVEHTKPVKIVIIEDGTLTDASWSDISSETATQYDTSATAISGGTETFAIPVGKSSNEYVAFTDDYYSYNLPPGKVLTFAAIANSGTNGEVSVALKVLERL